MIEKCMGIDYSINSPGLVWFNGKELCFRNIRRGYVADLVKIFSRFDHKDIHVGEIDDPFRELCIPFPKDNLNLYKDIEDYNTILINLIKREGITKVVIEDYSYASVSSSFIQIIEYQVDLRMKLYRAGIEFHAVSPLSIKKFATGDGRSSKYDLLIKFLEEEKNNYQYENNFWNNINYYKDAIIIKKPGKDPGVLKPFDDLIDAFYMFKYCVETDFEKLKKQKKKEKELKAKNKKEKKKKQKEE